MDGMVVDSETNGDDAEEAGGGEDDIGIANPEPETESQGMVL